MMKNIYGHLSYGMYYLDQQKVNLLETKKTIQYMMPMYYGDWFQKQ